MSYPTGFSRGILSTVTVQGIDANGTTFRKEPAIEWESAFLRELRHFHECITAGTPSRTSVAPARDDIALIIDIVKSYVTHAPTQPDIIVMDLIPPHLNHIFWEEKCADIF